MGIGIIVCGLNGSGKSTLGAALAGALGFHFIDNENLYFRRERATDPYRHPNSREEVARLLLEEVHAHPDFVFASVKGDYGKEILPYYDYAVFLAVPKEIRMQRVRSRSFQKFGSRVQPGGDLYEEEESFFRLIEGRSDAFAADWVQTLHCPVLRLDGTRPIAENVAYLLKKLPV